MIDIIDKTYKPSLDEIDDYIGSPLYRELCGHMEQSFKALCDVAYSGDKNLQGWNIRFHKAGRTLCRLYPQRGSFLVLLVIGQREKERTEALLPQMSAEMQSTYHNTQEGMGQRWMLLRMETHNAFYEDMLTLIAVRRSS